MLFLYWRERENKQTNKQTSREVVKSKWENAVVLGMG